MALRHREPRLVVPSSALALWFSLGGHYVEIAFLNGIRPRISSTRIAQSSARFAAWFAGGAGLYSLMAASARGLSIAFPRWGGWWIGGLAFIGLELFVHAVLALRRVPNFYAGDG
jgi:hypothetical protein